jgi:hypothetical protein
MTAYNNGSPTTMVTRQQWSLHNDDSPTTIAAWLSIGPCESASIAQGTLQEHEAIATRAREGANIAGGMPQEHEVILNRRS